MILTAKVIPWSSVVGTGLMLLDESGRCIGQLSLHNVQGVERDEFKPFSLALVERVADAINKADTP
jgi:hypothetical protein